MDSGEPTTYNEVIKATDVVDWQLAMESEITSIRKNHTRDLLELSDNRWTLPC